MRRPNPALSTLGAGGYRSEKQIYDLVFGYGQEYCGVRVTIYTLRRQTCNTLGFHSLIRLGGRSRGDRWIIGSPPDPVDNIELLYFGNQAVRPPRQRPCHNKSNAFRIQSTSQGAICLTIDRVCLLDTWLRQGDKSADFDAIFEYTMHL